MSRWIRYGDGSEEPSGKVLWDTPTLTVQAGEVPGRLVDQHTGDEVKDYFITARVIPSLFREDKRMKWLTALLTAGMLLIGGAALAQGDSEIPDLADLPTPVGADLLHCIDDPAGTPTSKKCTLTNVWAAHDSATSYSGVGSCSARQFVNSLSDESAPSCTYMVVRVHATDCTSIVDGSDGEMCFEQDANRIYICEPTAGGCDTAGEWIAQEIGEAQITFLTNDGSRHDHVTADVSGYVAGHGDGANCATGTSPEGVDGAGAVQNCIDPILETELTSLSDLNTQITASVADGAHTTDTRVNIKEANIEEQADATDVDFDGSDFDVTCVAGECDVTVNDGGLSHFTPDADPSVDHSSYVAGHVIEDNGVAETQRPNLNLISGGTVTVSCADDAGNSETDCTFTGSAHTNDTFGLTTFDLTDTDATPILTVDDTEQVQFIGAGTVTVAAAADGANHDVTITGSAHTADQVGTVNDGDFCQGGAGSVLDCDVTPNGGTDITADLEEEGQINATAVTGNSSATDEVILGQGANTAIWVTMPNCTDEAETLGYDAATNTFECNADAGAGGGMTSFDVQGDDGAPNVTITDGNTLVVSGGTNISTEDGDAGADTLTIDLDLTGITNGQILYDNADALGGISQFTYDGTNLTLTPTSGDDIAAEELVAEVYNASGATIFKCAAVYISGFNVGADLAEISVADADDVAKMPAVGLVRADIANGSAGFLVTAGDLLNADTAVSEVWSAGGAVYVNTSGTNTSADCGDTLTETKPTGTAQIQKMGIVSRVNAANGEIEVTGAGRSNDVPNIASANFWLGNASGVATAVSMSSDATMDNTGAVTVADNSHNHTASNISDQNAGTDITADLEEEAHASEHDGVGTVNNGEAIDTASQEAGFLEDGGAVSLTCGASNAGKMQVMDDSDLEWCDGAATPALQSVDSKIATHTAVVDAHIDHADNLTELNTQIGASLADGAHFSPTAGIDTDHGAGAIDQTTDFAGALCGTNEYLVDDGASWSCDPVVTAFTPTAGIDTDHGAGAIDQTTDFAGALCATGEYLVDDGASWSCDPVVTPFSPNASPSTDHSSFNSEVDARIGATVTGSAADDQMLIGSGASAATWSALPAGGTDGCSGSGDKPIYTASTNSWSCGTDSGAAGGDSITVNSVASEDGNFKDSLFIDWNHVTASSPDDIEAQHNYETLAGNPALNAGECTWNNANTGDGRVGNVQGGLICEGATADTDEVVMLFGDAGTGDSTIQYFVPGIAVIIVGNYTNDSFDEPADNPSLPASYGSFTDGGTGEDCYLYEGTTADNAEGCLRFTDPTIDRDITFPDASGEVSLLGQTIGAGEFAADAIDGDDIASSYAGRSLSETAGSPDTLDADAELYTEQTCINVDPNNSETNWLWIKIPRAATVTDLNCIIDNGTSVVLTANECDGNGGTCTAIEAAMTCTTTNTTYATSIDNTSIDADDWIRLTRGTVTGTVEQAIMCMEFQYND